jgi:hypothetical protein
VDTGRVPNSGSQSTTSASSIDKPSLVYQLQKMNGMEKKRRSRTRKDQPSADRPGQPYQKSNLHTRRTTTFDRFQHMALASQSAPDYFSSMSPGYHEFQNYSHELPSELRAHHSVSQAIPVDGSHLAPQSGDVYGSNRSCWSDYSRQQGRIELSAYPRTLESHPGGVLTARLAHWPEQTSATSSFPLTSHSLDAPPTGNPGGGYFYPDYEDRVAGTPVQNTHFLANRSPDAESPTIVPYHP